MLQMFLYAAGFITIGAGIFLSLTGRLEVGAIAVGLLCIAMGVVLARLERIERALNIDPDKEEKQLRRPAHPTEAEPPPALRPRSRSVSSSDR